MQLFIFFQRLLAPRKHLSMKSQRDYVYNNFRLLQSNQDNTDIYKRKDQQNILNVLEKINEIIKKKVVDKIGNYLNSPEATISFNCNNNKMVDTYIMMLQKIQYLQLQSLFREET